MIGTLIGLIFLCIILGVVWWAAQTIIASIPMAEPFPTLIRVLMILIFVIIAIWILVTLLGMFGIHVNTFNMSLR